MKMMPRFGGGSSLRAVYLLLTIGFFSAFVHADIEATFTAKCSACHSIGQGNLVGPDLKDLDKRRDIEWIVKFVQNSGNLIQSGDPQAVEIFNKFNKITMPAQDLSVSEIKQLVDYIKNNGQSSSETSSVSDNRNTFSGDKQIGKNLFLGRTKFKNGGPACLSCHSAGDTGVLGGGTLGPDLTKAFSRFTKIGLTSMLSNIAFPTMIPVYKDKALTENEIVHLAAFFEDVDNNTNGPLTNNKKFIFFGLAGFIVALLGMNLFWSSRRKGTKRPLNRKGR